MFSVSSICSSICTTSSDSRCSQSNDGSLIDSLQELAPASRCRASRSYSDALVVEQRLVQAQQRVADVGESLKDRAHDVSLHDGRVERQRRARFNYRDAASP